MIAHYNVLFFFWRSSRSQHIRSRPELPDVGKEKKKTVTLCDIATPPLLAERIETGCVRFFFFLVLAKDNEKKIFDISSTTIFQEKKKFLNKIMESSVPIRFRVSTGCGGPGRLPSLCSPHQKKLSYCSRIFPPFLPILLFPPGKELWKTSKMAAVYLVLHTFCISFQRRRRRRKPSLWRNSSPYPFCLLESSTCVSLSLSFFLFSLVCSGCTVWDKILGPRKSHWGLIYHSIFEYAS